MLRRTWSGAAGSVLAAAIATGAVAALLALLGKDSVAILGALIAGPFDPSGYRFAEALARACPLALCGLAVAIPFRCRAWNIGAEGQYLCGAIACTAVGLWGGAWPGWLLIPAMLASATLAGALWAWPAAWLEIRRSVPLVLSTILMNFIAVGLIKYLTQGPMRGSDPSAAQSDPIAESGYLPVLVSQTDCHIGVLLAAGACVAAWAYLRWHVGGYGLRAAGMNPTAAEWAGIPVAAVKRRAMGLAGGLAGLAGGLQIAGVHRLLHVQAAEGFGYVAIAVALLGRLHPIGVGIAAIFMGLLDVGAAYVEQQNELGVPADLAQIIKGIVVLVVLILNGPRLRRWLNPA